MGGEEVGHQLAHVVLGFPVLGAVVDADISIVAVGNGLLEPQQGASLRRVRPHGITAPGAGHVHIRLDGEVLHVMAAGAEAPFLGLGEVHVYLVHLHPSLVGIEAVFRGKLGQGRLGRAFEFLRREGDVGPLPGFVRAPLAPKDRLQFHPGLGEGVIGYQAGIGQGVQQVTAVDFLDEFHQLVPLTHQVADAFSGTVVLRFFLGAGFCLVQLILALLVAVALVEQLFQGFHQPGTQSIGVTVALHEVPQAIAHHIVHVPGQQGHEAVE